MSKMSKNKTNIDLEDAFVDAISDVINNNPGCLMFVLDVMQQDKDKKVKKGYTTLFFGRMTTFNITGDKLYKFWNDCCNRNTIKTIKIGVENSLDDILAHINDGGYGIPYED